MPRDEFYSRWSWWIWSAEAEPLSLLASVARLARRPRIRNRETLLMKAAILRIFKLLSTKLNHINPPVSPSPGFK